jgi:hypothetical protein
MEEPLHKLELSALVDMLANRTAEYTRLLKEGGKDEDFNVCKTTITMLQSEIESRKQTASNTTLTNPDINYTQDSSE